MNSAAVPPPPAAAPVRRLVLVPAAPSRDDAQLRRFRLARLRLEGRETEPAQRFVHLKRSYD